MGQVTYVEHDGRRHVIELEDGFSIMEGAILNGVPGIDADCGGKCACATCHVHVEGGWGALAGEAGEQEAELLELAPERDGASRLSCQIVMSPEINGIVVRLPESQH